MNFITRKYSLKDIIVSIFFLILLFAIFYSSYRYPLQISSSGTSPTYGDTPFVLQFLKYPLLILFAFINILLNKSIYDIHNKDIKLMLVILVGYPLYKFIKSTDFNHLNFSATFIIAYLCICSFKVVEARSIDKCINFIFLVGSVVNIVQIILFLSINRLPALAYYGSFSVRFGSFLDDPNGFAAICFLFIGYYFKRNKFKASSFQLYLSIFWLLITQSFTAYIFGVLLFVSLHYKNKLIWSCLIACLTFLVVYFDPSNLPALIDIYQSKKSSMTDHIMIFNTFEDFTYQDYLIGSAGYVFSEQWWMQALLSYGIFWMLLCFFFNAYAILKSLSKYKQVIKNCDSPILFGFTIFFTYILFGSFNLPFLTIFPVNFIYFIFFLLIIENKIKF